MNRVALALLLANPGKFLGIVSGVAFAALLIAQQASIFCGLMRLTASPVRDVTDASIWVMDPNVEFVDDVKPMSDDELYRVRGVPGVARADRFYKSLSRARFEDGRFRQVILIGVDGVSLVGGPKEMVAGRLADLARPDAVIMDDRGARELWPDDPLRLGREFEMNDRRAVLVGVCRVSRTFQTFPVVYARYARAVGYAPPERKVLSFVLARPVAGADPAAVCAAIAARTGLKAETGEQFQWTTIAYYLRRTGIPVNFGITVLLGFVVGTAVAGQTFYLFTVENLRQFGTLKALGVSNGGVLRVVLTQAAVVGVLGFGLGVGGAALFGLFTRGLDKLAFYMPWPVLVGTGAACVLIVLLSSLLSVRRALALEPAVVFKGG